MGIKAIENRIRKLREIESQVAVLEEQAAALKDELKADMDTKGVEELETKEGKVSWKQVASSRLDGAALRKALPEIYAQFTRRSTTRRFTLV